MRVYQALRGDSVDRILDRTQAAFDWNLVSFQGRDVELGLLRDLAAINATVQGRVLDAGDSVAAPQTV